ncbi:MAG TPA: orotidine-5'-phosphate decarboxylase [Candidatus Thalassarchaeaceae archaeon]|nr:MAG TPA: orotidine-5'-phosphate decarboxylase [Candidatus Poseidoniales archaeon]HIH84240.1 orotidine-5'-phosphate decarboxylase [Candidatus Thalassarchaeaceae archaeon]
MSAEIWGNLWSLNRSAFARRYMVTAIEKETLVCLAADLRTMADIKALITEVGPYIACLKLHVDIVDDWDIEGWMEICELAKNLKVAIWEDRKFADIGRVSRQQMAGAFDIRSWADIVTAHLISGPDIVQGLQNGWGDVGREGGVLLLAQMSSRGNLLNEEYTTAVVKHGNEIEGVLGYIGNGSEPNAIRTLRDIVGSTRMIWTPGINLNVGDGVAGQRYGRPREAVLAGADCLIVGSGIHQSQNRGEMAAEYARISWQALLDR